MVIVPKYMQNKGNKSRVNSALKLCEGIACLHMFGRCIRTVSQFHDRVFVPVETCACCLRKMFVLTNKMSSAQKRYYLKNLETIQLYQKQYQKKYKALHNPNYKPKDTKESIKIDHAKITLKF
jgi:hypothetical protein